MSDMNEISQATVKELFNYRDGELYWKVSAARCINIGDLAGYVNTRGYRTIHVDYKCYLAHRLIFLFHHGYLPKFLDHIDGDRANNNITNLREATKQENGMNRKKNKSYGGKQTSSEFKGVSWNKHAKKWQAKIVIDGKMKYLGLFKSEIGAAKAYDIAATKNFGEYARLNTSATTNPLQPITTILVMSKGEILPDEQRAYRSKAWKQAISGEKFIYNNNRLHIGDKQ